MARAAMHHYYQHLIGGFWFETAYRRLLDTLPSNQPSVWVEIGVFHGKSLAFLGTEAINRNLPLTIHAVDSFAGWPGTLRGEDLEKAFQLNITLVAEQIPVTIHPLPSVTAAARMEKESADVVWIDADHSYEACKADIEAWLPILKPCGFMGGDDFNYAGVTQAVRESFPAYETVPGYRWDPTYKGEWPSWLAQK